jgi:hypothetical protein
MVFNVSFTEVLVVVTGAGLLLGRREILTGSRAIGNAVGRVVGVLHGLRVKYEEKSKGTEIYQAHSTVRSGLMDLRTVGYDLMNISPLASPPLGGISRSSSASAFSSANIASTIPESRLSGEGVISSPGRESMAPLSSSSTAERVSIANHPGVTYQNTGTNAQALARLILAEEELNIRLGKPPASASSSDEMQGSDLLHSVLSDTIIAEAYREHQSGSQPTRKHVDV